jgi:galactose mutarotase-like enzyme
MNLKRVNLENSRIRVVISPYGGKIISMFNKSNSSEWLFQSESENIEPASDGSFTKEVAFGCDEMFPTILRETSRQKNGSQVDLPDHGELWSSEWEILSQSDDSLEMRFDGKILPYRFVRNILLSDNSIICRYTVINLSDADFPALWTPHPLFSFLPETEIVVPEDCRSIKHASDAGELGPYLNKIEWGEGGQVPEAGQLLRPGTLKEGSAYKFYCSDPLSEGKVQINDSRGQMTMSYPASILPWLGFWINNGGFGGQYNIAPEPATAPFDSPSRSESFGIPAVWKAAEIREWELSYSLEV